MRRRCIYNNYRTVIERARMHRAHSVRMRAKNTYNLYIWVSLAGLSYAILSRRVCPVFYTHTQITYIYIINTITCIFIYINRFSLTLGSLCRFKLNVLYISWFIKSFRRGVRKTQ